MSENSGLIHRAGANLGERLGTRGGKQREGLLLLASMVAVMWIVEVINTLDSNGLDGDGIYARNVGRFWGILTSPFIHASFAHLTDNTIPFVFLGVIIALKGAKRLALVTGFVILIGGLGTWLISPSAHHIDTIGCSGVVFGYATYLLTRGVFNRNILELVVAAVVGVVWGAVLLSSLVPHTGVSWQGHLCGGIAGVIVAWRLSVTDRRRRGAGAGAAASAAPAGSTLARS
jgi:membrane associated rhomboid family serine protease